jgi:hypothetical protein
MKPMLALALLVLAPMTFAHGTSLTTAALQAPDNTQSPSGRNKSHNHHARKHHASNHHHRPRTTAKNRHSS